MTPANHLIVFRADASRIMGTGHVMRCLALAGALRDAGADVVFVSRPHDGHLCDYIEQQRFKVIRLDAPTVLPKSQDNPIYVEWLGRPSQEDAAETLSAIQSLGHRPAWIVVDHYGADKAWETALRHSGANLFVIDDLPDRQHDCDVLLNQNELGSKSDSYAARVPHDCILLLGPKYALLQPLYADLHKRVPLRKGPVERVLVFLGDAGADDVTGRVLRALTGLGFSKIHVDVVVGRNSPHLEAIKRSAAAAPNVIVHQGVPTLAPLMAQADIAVGAGGSSSWERLCLGLPSLIITLADNQKPIAENLHRTGLARWLGDFRDLSDEKLNDALRNVLENPLPESWSRLCRSAVDGRGVFRVGAMLGQRARALAARTMVPDDFSLVSEVSDMSRVEFERSLRDMENNSVFILETPAHVEIGFVRFVAVHGQWVLQWALHPFYEKQPGAVQLMIGAAMLGFRQARVDALTLSGVENIGSHRAVKSSVQNEHKINICSDRGSWINPYVAEAVVQWVEQGHHVTWSHDASQLDEAKFCFYLSYGRIVKADVLKKAQHNLVVHESDLPKGRGWSPLSWQILEGKSEIVATLFEAADSVDSGKIYKQETMTFDGSELVDELRAKQAQATIKLCDAFVKNHQVLVRKARDQTGEPSYYPRRTPVDSKLDASLSIADQFNQLRIADNVRYPAYIDLAGHRYYVRIERA